MTSPFQTTLKHAVTCKGIALHSGANVSMTLHPAEADHGIVFKRSDVLAEAALVSARYDAVCDTRLGTTIVNAHGTKIMTVEHLMAALWGCGVDNCLIELEGPEIPIMDGSSEPFVFLIECAGIQPLSAMREVLEVTRVVAVEEGGSTALIAPSDHFSLDITIQFDHQKVGTQQAVYDFELTSFNQSLSRARTFGFARDVQMLREKGLAKGASLNNAIALGDDHDIMNKEGLRYDNEFVRHKALDCVGDYYLAGYIIRGAVTTFRPGHGINNLLIRELLADERNYRLVPLQGVMPAPEVIANNVAVVSAAV